MSDTEKKEFNIDDYEPVVQALSNVFSDREYAKTFISEAIDVSSSMYSEGFSKYDVASSFNLITIIVESLFPSTFMVKYVAIKTAILLLISQLQFTNNNIKYKINRIKLDIEKAEKHIAIKANDIRESGEAKNVEMSKILATRLYDIDANEKGLTSSEEMREMLIGMENDYENNLTIIVFWKNILTTIDNYFEGVYHNASVFDNSIFFEHTLKQLISNISGHVNEFNSEESEEENHFGSTTNRPRPTPRTSEIP